MPPKTLSHLERYNAIRSLLLNQAEDDATVATAMGRAREIRDIEEAYELLALSDEHLALIGWTRVELIIAKDAKLGRQAVPFYLQAANERHITRMRVVSEQDGGGEESTVYVIPTRRERPQLPAIEVDGVEE